MKVIIVAITLFASINADDIFLTAYEECEINENIKQDYRNDMNKITANLYQYVGPNAFDKNFVFFPLSVWITASTIAEGVDPEWQPKLFDLLRLSDDPCVRYEYYKMATNCFISADDVDIRNNRILVIDEGASINHTYHRYLTENELMDVITAPIRSDPDKALAEMRQISSAKISNLDLSGNSVILDTVDYNGLWSTAFEDAVIERTPFYCPKGVKIGAVDIMKVKTRARVSYYPTLNVKGLELPVGKNDRYRFVFALILDDNAEKAVNLVTSKVVDGFIKSFTGDFKPIDVAIPKFNLTGEFDIRNMLENSGLKKLWKDPTLTRLISEPAALPSAFVHRSSVTVDKAGVKPSKFKKPFNTTLFATTRTNKHSFIANRPFLMGIFDTNTWTVVMAGGFMEPTYSLNDI